MKITKIEKVLIGTIVAIIIATVLFITFVTVPAIKEVEKVGLKPIIEKVWNGER